MRLRTSKVIGFLAVGILIAGVAAASAQTDVIKPKSHRWESNLSAGGTANHRFGLIKSVWYFAIPKILAVGLSADCIMREAIPFSIDVALNAPIPIVRPFVCAGAGGSLSGGGVSGYGGGLKVTLIKRFGIIVEWRRYRYTYKVSEVPVIRDKATTTYLGAGIHWVY